MPTISPDELIQQLQWRYATKAFDPAATIEEDTWSAIEESLVLTPSSFGLQPWKFIVITDPAMKSLLLPHSWNQHQVVDCSHYVVLAAPTDVGPAKVSVTTTGLTPSLVQEESQSPSNMSSGSPLACGLTSSVAKPSRR